MKYMTHLFIRKWALPERFRNRWDSDNLYLICIFSELVSKLRVYTDDLGPRATQCMASSPILGSWRPDAWTRKIRFPHLVRNSFKTAIFDHDSDNFWPEATHGSFGPCLGTSEEVAPEALHHTMYGKLLHTMRDKIPHTMENHTMYETYNVCTIQCIKTSIHSVKVSNPRYIPKCQPKHVFGKKKLKKHTNIQQ